MSMESEDMALLTAQVAAAFVGHNTVAISDLPRVITDIHGALMGLGGPATPAAPVYEPAVPPSRSIKPDHLISLIDGRPYKMLRRHLMTHYGMTPDDYRTKWGLPADYPMVAPNYAERRRALAKEIGLGTKGRGGGRKRKVKA